jgi:hypothetical protein
MATPKHFRPADIADIGLGFGALDISPEIRCISGRFGSADNMCVATHIDGSKKQTDMFRVMMLETLHGTQHFGTDFGSLNSSTFGTDFRTQDT